MERIINKWAAGDQKEQESNELEAYKQGYKHRSFKVNYNLYINNKNVNNRV